MIDYERLLKLIEHYDPEYKHDYFTVLSTDLDSEWWIILESWSDIHAWADLDGTLVKVSKLVNGFTVMYCKV